MDAGSWFKASVLQADSPLKPQGHQDPMPGWMRRRLRKRKWVPGGKGKHYPIIPSHSLMRLCEAQNHRCGYCGEVFVWLRNHPLEPTRDHVIALSKRGPRGHHNQIAACFRCNGSRKNRDALEYFALRVFSQKHRWPKPRIGYMAEYKVYRTIRIRAWFASLGIPTDEKGKPLDSLRDCWPKPRTAKTEKNDA